MINLNPQKAYIVAEIAGAHQGEFIKAHDLIYALKRSGADAIKFQYWKTEHLVNNTHPKYEHFKKIELKFGHWVELINVAKDLGMDLIFDIYHIEAVKFLKAKQIVVGLKITASDLLNDELIIEACCSGKTILLGVGGATNEEIKHAVKLCNKNYIHPVLIYGHQVYPTPLNDTNINQIKSFPKEFTIAARGFADHFDAESELGLAQIIPIAAFCSGAQIIEKHAILKREKNAIDRYSALEPDEFKEMVLKIRMVEVALGKEKHHLTETESKYRDAMRKRIVVNKAIRRGKRLKIADIAFKRATTGMFLDKVKIVVGKTIRKAMVKDEPLTEGVFTWK